MTTKPHKTRKPNLSPLAEGLARGVTATRAFASGLSEQAVLDGATGIAIAIAISLLLIHYKRSVITPLAAGAIAQYDIIAPETLKVEDAQETNRQRQQASSVVLPVFDYNPRAD